MEAELRGERKLAGTLVILGNGEEWTVPSMPLGPKGKSLAKMMDEIGSEEDVTDENKVLDRFFDFMLTVLQINYPGLTREAAEEVTLFHMAMYKDITKSLVPWAEPKKD